MQRLCHRAPGRQDEAADEMPMSQHVDRHRGAGIDGDAIPCPSAISPATFASRSAPTVSGWRNVESEWPRIAPADVMRTAAPSARRIALDGGGTRRRHAGDTMGVPPASRRAARAATAKWRRQAERSRRTPRASASVPRRPAPARLHFAVAHVHGEEIRRQTAGTNAGASLQVHLTGRRRAGFAVGEFEFASRPAGVMPQGPATAATGGALELHHTSLQARPELPSACNSVLPVARRSNRR